MRTPRWSFPGGLPAGDAVVVAGNTPVRAASFIAQLRAHAAAAAADRVRERPLGLRVAVVVWIAIIGVATGVRLWGITWGAPRIDLNPDEFLVLRIASRLTWSDPNPHFFSYSGFIFHQSFLTSEALKLVGVQLSDLGRLVMDRSLGVDIVAAPGVEAADVGRLLMHRLWSVLWGVLTVALVFHITRRLGGARRAAFLAAALMAVMPLHVWEAHFGTTDSPLLFWMMGSLLVSLLVYEQPTWRRVALGGLLTGFAIGTKYPGAFALVPLAVAITLVTLEGRLPGRRAVACAAIFGATAIVGSFLVSPFSYVQAFQAAAAVAADPRGESSIAAFLFEYNAMQEGVFGFDLHAPGWQYHPYIYELGAAWPFSLGLALYLLVLAGVVSFVRRLDGKRLVALAFVAAYFGVIGSWQFVPLRYSLPILPLLVVMAAGLLDRLLDRQRPLGVAIGTLVAAYTLAFTVTTTHRFSNDTRLQAAVWADQNLNPGSVVLMAHTRSRFSYVPRLDQTKLRSRIVRLQVLEGTARSYRRQLGKPDPGAPTVYVGASSIDYLRYYRSGVPESIQAWDALRADSRRFRLVKTFEATYLNKSFYQRLDPMFASYFVSPRIEFYEFLR